MTSEAVKTLAAWRSAMAAVALGVLAAPAVLAGAPTAPDGPEPVVLDEPSVTGLINDGDESLAEAVVVYLDGCPLLSIAPPADGSGKPAVTMAEPYGECVAVVSAAAQNGPSPLAVGVEEGMHVQVWNDAADEDGDEVSPAGGRTLIVDISNLYPVPRPSSGLFAGEPVFYIPGVFGDPSGNLIVASADDGPDVLLGGGIGPGGSAFGGGGSGGSGIFDPGTPGGTGGSGPELPDVTAVPIPATLVLLLGALFTLRSYVRRA